VRGLIVDTCSHFVILKLCTTIVAMSARRSRLTKAHLEEHFHGQRNELIKARAENEQLKSENEQLKRRISRGHDRSRSPRMPATSSQINVEMTCRALNQVRLWQNDVVNQEHRNEIERLKELVDLQADQIARLRRGEGAVGPILQHIHERQISRYNLDRPEDEANLFLAQNARQTRPVHEILETLYWAADDIAQIARYGGTMTSRVLPRLQ